MKLLEVPFSYGFLANNVMQECPLGSKKIFATGNILAAVMPVRIHCKIGSTPSRLVLESNARVWQRTEMMIFLHAVDIFCNTGAAIIVRQFKSPEDREIGRRFKLLWEVLAPK